VPGSRLKLHVKMCPVLEPKATQSLLELYDVIWPMAGTTML